MNNLSGMTGFARVTGEAEWGAWAWEAKSVNGRGLDVRVNTPPGFDALERVVKAAASKRFNRGSLQVSLRIELSDQAGGATIDHALLDTLLAAQWCLLALLVCLVVVGSVTSWAAKHIIV